MTREEALFRQRLLKAGGFAVGPLDGIWGPKSIAADNDFRAATAELRRTMGLPFDERTESNIATLLLPVQRLARYHLGTIVIAQAGSTKPRFEVKIISGTRTYPEQNAIYAQGRTKPGPIVTKAKGGQSYHNFGIAYDVGVFIGDRYADGKVKGDNALYEQLAPLRPVALAWGGHWPSKDRPHYQAATGLTLTELRRRFERGEPYLPN